MKTRTSIYRAITAVLATCALMCAVMMVGCAKPAEQTVVVPTTTDVAITLNAEGYNPETDSPAILCITNADVTDGDENAVDTYVVVKPNSDIAVALEDGTYTVSAIWPVAADGAVYKPAADTELTFNVNANSTAFALDLSKTTLNTEELENTLETVKLTLADNNVDEATATQIINAYQSAYDAAVAADTAKAEAEANAAAEAEATANATTYGDSSATSGNSSYSGGSSSYSGGSSSNAGSGSSNTGNSASSGGETIDYGVQKNTQTDNPEGVAGDKALGDEINKVFG